MSAVSSGNSQWSLQAYRYTAEFTGVAWAWEYLRRNPNYRTDTAKRDPALATNWSLLRFEDPELDARHADVFWQPHVGKHVLPLIADAKPQSEDGQCFSMDKLRCRVIVHDAAEYRHVLFTEHGRALQIVVAGHADLQKVTFLTPVLAPPQLRFARLLVIRRFSDLLLHGYLRPSLYPPENRAQRLMQILLALDASFAGVHHRDIAIALFGEGRVDRDWHHPHNYLRDHIRRAIAYGRDLMNGGYVKFLR